MIEIQTVSEMPDLFQHGKWREVFDAAEKMVLGQIIRITVENHAAVRSVQSSLQGSHAVNRKPRNTLRERGYRFQTRTRPINGKDGQWHIFIKRIA